MMETSQGLVKPVYSVSQLATFSKCSTMYRLQYIDKVQQTRASDAMLLGTATGAAVQQLVVERKGSPITLADARTAFAHAFTTVFSEAMPLQLVNYCLEILEGKTQFEVVADGGHTEKLDLKTFLAFVDAEFLKYDTSLTFQYKAVSMSHRQKGYRFLEAIKWYPACVHNAYMTMQEGGLLQGLKEITPEHHGLLIGKQFDAQAYFDLRLEYENGKVCIVELKTSRPDEKMAGASACDQNSRFVSLSLQANAYYYFGKRLWPEQFAGVYWLNSSYQKHFVKFEVNADQQAMIPARFKTLHRVRELMLSEGFEFTNPACGTGNKNLMVSNKMCSVHCSCPFV